MFNLSFDRAEPVSKLDTCLPFLYFRWIRKKRRKEELDDVRPRIHPPPLRFADASAEVQNQSKSNHFPFAKSVENGDFMLTDMIRVCVGLTGRDKPLAPRKLAARLTN